MKGLTLIAATLLLAVMIPAMPGYAVSNSLLVERFYYFGTEGVNEGDEYIKICNTSADSISLNGYKIGDEETSGGDEGMYNLPAERSLAGGECIIVAKLASEFIARFSIIPEYELAIGGADDPAVANLIPYETWAIGDFGLDNAGDEILLLNPDDVLLDGACYAAGVANPAAGVIFTDGCTQLHTLAGQGLRRQTLVDHDRYADFLLKTPTAVGLQSFEARSGADGVQAIIYAISAALLVTIGGSALAYAVSRRRIK
ncbi:MAG: lamin tail domain-containing protein [Chloroflexi bacterium]|nr:lamin tail domain-containing protein [Chloroflexota bacterium]